MDIIPPRKLGPRPPDQPAPTRTNPLPKAQPPAAANTGRFSGFSPSGQNSSLRSVLSTIILFATAFSIAILLNTFVLQSYQVDGQSMENSLQNNDRLIVNKVPRTISRLTGHQYVPHRGEIIIFNQSGLPGFAGEKQLIKRVIGLPGDRVVVSGGKITIYNSGHPNGFNPDISGGYHIDAANTVGNVDLRLQKDELFVCGDNRGNSEDSRYFGPVKTSQVVAKLVLRILPFNKAQGF